MEEVALLQRTVQDEAAASRVYLDPKRLTFVSIYRRKFEKGTPKCRLCRVRVGSRETRVEGSGLTVW